jgi:ubiquinone biosynthesis accessory factor UbiJ
MTDAAPRTPNPLLQAAGRALEAVLARALALDPETAAALDPLDGRRITLQLEQPPLAMSVRVEGRLLRIGPAFDLPEPDLSLRATAGALLAQLLPSSSAAAPGGRMRISGDAELAQHVQRLVKGFSPDLDAAFAGVFGDVVGVQIARVFREAFAGGRRVGGKLLRDGVEYLTEERRDLVGRVEQEVFLDEVDTLRDAVERLEARVQRLRRARGSTS